MQKSNVFSVLVVGDAPEELLSKYDIKAEVKQYVKYKYLDSQKYQDRSIKALEKILDDADKIGIDNTIKERLRERLKVLSKMSSFEYYKELTDGMYYDSNGNALTTENPNGKWATCHIGRNFSLPFKLKDGSESYKAKVKDIDWDFMCSGKKPIYEATWELVMENRDPKDEQEERILSFMKDKQEYFKKFISKEDYASYNSMYWNYAYLDRKGWKDIDSDSIPKGNEKWWINNFYDTFIKPLDEDTMLSIYECSIN